MLGLSIKLVMLVTFLLNLPLSTRFVKGPRPGIGTGFDMDESDLLDMEQCRGVVVASAVFGLNLHHAFQIIIFL